MNAYAQTIDRPPLERAVITIDRIIDPKGPGKPAAIKTTNGMSFGIWPDKTAGVRVGEVYEIEFDTNGAYRNIKTIRASGRPGPAPSQFTTGAQDYGQQQNAPRQVQTAAAEPQRQAPQQNGNGNGGNYYRPTSPKDSRRMFICSQMNALITSHQVQVTAQGIADAIMMLSDAYDATLGREDQ